MTADANAIKVFFNKYRSFVFSKCWGITIKLKAFSDINPTNMIPFVKQKCKFLVKHFYTIVYVFIIVWTWWVHFNCLDVLWIIKCQYYFSYKTHRSHQTTYESPTPTPAVTEYEMPVSICKNTKEGYEELAVDFRASAVYHTIPN